MTTFMSTVIAGTEEVRPQIRDINRNDLIEVLKKGLDDFLACPTHLVLLALIYPIVGLLLGRMIFGYDIVPLLFPIISGFALIGPVAAVGLYEMSRRREKGQDISWKYALEAFKSPSIGSILALGAIQLVIYVAWLAAALLIYAMTFGNRVPESIPGFAYEVLTTPAGWALMIIGCGVGFLFALAVLVTSVMSFPMMLHRNVGLVTAVKTSIRAVMVNPFNMAVWGAIVVVLLTIGIIPFFIGLAVVMPVLGHATWHLYRKVVML